jgi:hypothetical protein
MAGMLKTAATLAEAARKKAFKIEKQKPHEDVLRSCHGWTRRDPFVAGKQIQAMKRTSATGKIKAARSLPRNLRITIGFHLPVEPFEDRQRPFEEI